MSAIFISHSSKDNEYAKELERELAKQNHSSVFLDIDPDKGIIGGQSWEQTLYRKLRACRAVIAICTDDYLSSRWCFAEIALARMEGKPIFALKVEGLSADARLPSILSENQYIKMHPDPEDGYTRLWNGLREMDLLGLVGEWSPNEPPYLGLSAFQEKHAPVFFGREHESRSGVELLERGSPNLIMTLGASGSGKSSLVRAGILPRLRQDSERWLIVEPFRPGSNPYYELADAFLDTFKRYAPEHLGKLGSVDELTERLKLSASQHHEEQEEDQGFAPDISDDERVQRLMQQLEELNSEPPDNAHGKFLQFLDWSMQDLKRIVEDPEQALGFNLNISPSILIELAEELKRASGKSHARVLIVVDQFEELLSRRKTKQFAHDFLRLLRYSIEAEHTPIMVMGTMRSDFFGQFQHNTELRGVDFESLSIGPMTIDGIRRVIEAPARLAAIELETGLADRLIEDTGNTTALPLLSFTLWKMWRDFREDGKIEIKEYESLGGLNGAIASEADALINKDNQELVRNAFLQMVRLTDEGVYARRPVTWESDALKPVHDVLDKFIERRLLFVRDSGGDKIVEVAHESLFTAWQPLHGWLNEYRSELVLKKDLSREAKSWQEAGRPRDNLWRGNRLSHAKNLKKAKQLNEVEARFVKASGRRQWLIRIVMLVIGWGTFLSMAGLTAYSVDAENEAQAAYDDAQQSYEHMIETVITVAHKLLPDGSTPGAIAADLERFNLQGVQRDTYLVARGFAGEGRVLAVAHGAAISAADAESELFAGPALAWVGLHLSDPQILYSVGHCEVVSDSSDASHRLPMEAFEAWEYRVKAIGDLTQLAQHTEPTILIIGNAWAQFSEAELTAIETFVNNGGGLLLAGLGWSWEQYRNRANEFNPCNFNQHPSPALPDSSAYAMNTLGQRFGLTWVD